MAVAVSNTDRDWAISTGASYSAGPGFYTRPQTRCAHLRFYLVFCSPFRMVIEQYDVQDICWCRPRPVASTCSLFMGQIVLGHSGCLESSMLHVLVHTVKCHLQHLYIMCVRWIQIESNSVITLWILCVVINECSDRGIWCYG